VFHLSLNNKDNATLRTADKAGQQARLKMKGIKETGHKIKMYLPEIFDGNFEDIPSLVSSS
jgi:hypothetical protein